MASIKLKFNPSSTPHSLGTLYYQVIHQRIIRRISTSFHIFPSEWDMRLSSLSTSVAPARRQTIASFRERIHLDIECFSRIIRSFEQRAIPYSAEDIIEKFRRYSSRLSLFSFMSSVIASLRANGKIRTAETYAATLRSFRKFRNEEDVMLDAFSPSLMEAYEAWLRNRGITLNTVSFYLRILRAVYNRALEEDMFDDRKPFRHVYTGVDKTVKRALPLRLIKKIKALNLKNSPNLELARDIFLLSFMLRGMSFIDMAFLKKSDLRNGYIIYRRRKTGQQLMVAWTKDMQHILDKYPENNTPYLLPILSNPNAKELYLYRNMGYKVNHNLKLIALRLGIEIPLTMYVARHSWASAAQSKGIPLSVISKGMGHDSEKTTRIYLASLDTTLIDRANALILKSI
ncbi:MAG: site-specific integrase [Muribaculaceae bacterium]|nr:site-specific integrase [Muribaculaceae bacterium]